MYSNTDVLVTEISKGHICITNSEGNTLNSTFLVTNAITLEVTDAYHLWRLLKGHVAAEILRRKCALQLLQNRDLRKTVMQKHPKRRANRNTASRLFATTKTKGLNNIITHRTGQKASHLFPTTNPLVLSLFPTTEDPYCDRWGCLNKKTHGDFCDTCFSSQPRTGTHRGSRETTSVGTPLATRRPKNNQRRAVRFVGSHSHFDTKKVFEWHGGRWRISRHQTRREQGGKPTEASNAGTPSATPRITVSKQDSKRALIVRPPKVKTIDPYLVACRTRSLRETQMRQTHTREQGHRNETK